MEAVVSGVVPVSYHSLIPHSGFLFQRPQPPNLWHSQALVNNLDFSHFTVRVGESTAEEGGEAMELGPCRGVGSPGRKQTLSQGQESFSDFIARKDLRKLV